MALKRLEPCAGKLACTVLRGANCSNAVCLLGAMAYVSIKEIYLNELLTTADLYKAAVGFLALNGINMIPINIISEGISYIKSYNELSLTEMDYNTEVCNLGGYDDLYNNGEL